MQEELTSVADLIDRIREVRADHANALWFRGQSDYGWKLLPGFQRQDNKVSETTLLARFKQSAAMLTSSRPASSFDWIFLMQHYGVPTRLLDWTESPLVALYFAIEDVSDAYKYSDAAFWMLKPSELNKNANINDKDEADYIPSFDDEEVSGYSTEQIRTRQRLELFPIATIATRNNPRIQAQHGTFTIHHNAKTAIEEVGNGSHCIKLKIPNASKESLRKELSILGVNRFSLFPEMDSIGNILKGML